MASSVKRQFEKLMAAVEANSYDDFVADGNVSFQANVRPQMLKATSVQVAPRIKRGYAAKYLGALNRNGGYIQHLWKLTFKDGKSDRIAKLCLKDDKVHYFYIT
jgi:hypothetical protein